MVDILFFGDVVGRSGRQAVRSYLAGLANGQYNDPLPDVVIANGENATHGFGLSEGHYQELLQAGVHIITGGNHIWDRRETVHYIGNAPYLLRPANMPSSMPGVGAQVFHLNGHTVGVINLMGQVFMGTNTTPPWQALEACLPHLKKETPVIVVDFHAEASAEKVSLGHYASQLGVSAFVGTHTHVQTADEQILNSRTGYLTDAGFNGAHHSVIGMGIEESLVRLKSLVPQRLEVAEGGPLQVNGVRFRINSQTGQCSSVQRVNHLLTPSPS
ncbi:MAG: TIGR00282 family metallophosphoesterase [Vampirovibrionales bacterium]